MDQLNNYFNVTLRDYLEYPETFKINVLSDRIQLLPNVTSELLKTIKDNKEFKENLIIEVSKIIAALYPNSKFKEVYLSSHGTDIEIRYTLNTSRSFGSIKSEELPTEIFGIIFSYVEKTDVESFEKIEEYKHIYNDPKFWINLVNNKFEKYLRPGYSINYRDLYYGIISYENYVYIIQNSLMNDKNLLFSIYDRYPEAIKYLLLTKQFEIDDKKSIRNRLITHFNNKRPVIRNELILYIDDVDIFKMYMNNFVNSSYVYQYDNLLVNYSDLGPNIFSYYFNLENENANNPSEIFNTIIEMSDQDNEKIEGYLIDQILNMLPTIKKDDLHQFFLDVAENGMGESAVRKLWPLVKDRFTPREIQSLNEQTVYHYHDTGDDTMVNFFGEPKFKDPEEESDDE